MKYAAQRFSLFLLICCIMTGSLVTVGCGKVDKANSQTESESNETTGTDEEYNVELEEDEEVQFK